MIDWRSVGMDGTGCYWSVRQNEPVLFAASRKTATVRIEGRLIVLEPAPGAGDLFPFTYASWRSLDLEVTVLDSSVVRATGSESVTTEATLIVIRRGATLRRRGSMICGS